ncbi:MAG: hypothetical protein U9R36_05095 [Elusimicrobiota bacterium]|nr:hypothetical protein [Elusimicrobiota bacterium]
MKNIRFILFISVIPFITYGCQQVDLAEYDTPGSAYETYLQQARTLRVVADHRHYRRAIRCFTKENREWFEENYQIIPADREEEVYENLYRTKQYAYVFGRSVVLEGPSPDNKEYTVTALSDDSARIEVEGYGRDIELVKVDDSWQITDLFGVRKFLVE